MKKTLAVILVLLLGMTMLAGCGSSSSSQGSGSGNAGGLSGTWKLTSAEDEDGKYNAEDLKSIGASGEIVLNEDKTFSFTFFGETAKGTWSSEDNKTVVLTLTPEDEDEEDELIVVLEGDKLVLNDGAGTTMFFTK